MEDRINDDILYDAIMFILSPSALVTVDNFGIY